MLDKKVSECPNNHSIHVHNLISPYSPYWMVLINIVTVLLFIFLLDRVLYPLCCPWFPSIYMLCRIGIGMCAGLISIICALITEAIRLHRFMSVKSKSVIHINKLRFINLFAINYPVGIMTLQFIVQAIAECLVLITSKKHSYIANYN